MAISVKKVKSVPAKTATTSQSKKPREIAFDYIKSNFFRVIRADGAHGGLAPNGSIHMAIYSERHPIPTKVVHALEGNKLGPEIREKRESRDAIVREVEVDVVLDLEQAIGFRRWLDERIAQATKRQAELLKQQLKSQSTPNKERGDAIRVDGTKRQH